MSNEAKLRQRSLLEGDQGPLPKEVEAKVLELLVELLIGVLPVKTGDRSDEQDQR